VITEQRWERYGASAVLNPHDNGGESVSVTVETVDDCRRLVFSAGCYGASESRICSYTYTVDGLEGVIEILMKERDRLLSADD